ncbi:DUF7344 domain-containing protein [Haloarcula brevis]|uniref:DUF7344 domain-containing protein n=1 Tax=Haloarcula brevis TaxID=3111453 RepID=UPI00300E8409
MSDERGETGDSLSELFEMLSHTYRRRILMAVAHHNPNSEDDITSEGVTDEDENDDEALNHLSTEFYHVHLPKLADAGLINWNRDTGVITRGPRFEEIEPLLTLMQDHEDELPDGWP